MRMKFALLASGSKGNAFVLKEGSTAIMIDCGTTGKYLRQSLAAIHQPIDELDALLITHTHSDHISQIRLFRELNIYSPIEIDGIDSFMIRPLSVFHVGCFAITPVALSHDAPETTGFIISDGQEKLVYITDTGYLKESYFPLMKGADYFIMESNHDVEMLMKTRRPQYLKARIYGDEGHLNNEDCAEILNQLVTENTKTIVLAHISQQANTREKALSVTRDKLEHAHSGKLNPHLCLAAAGQNEMIRKGETYEEMDMGSCYCYFELDADTNHSIE